MGWLCQVWVLPRTSYTCLKNSFPQFSPLQDLPPRIPLSFWGSEAHCVSLVDRSGILDVVFIDDMPLEEGTATSVTLTLLDGGVGQKPRISFIV